jgi:hypothetical protein
MSLLQRIQWQKEQEAEPLISHERTADSQDTSSGGGRSSGGGGLKRPSIAGQAGTMMERPPIKLPSHSAPSDQLLADGRVSLWSQLDHTSKGSGC